jgi:preprotein translocase subunit SecG
VVGTEASASVNKDSHKVDRGPSLPYVAPFRKRSSVAMLFTFLLVVQFIIAALLVVVILMQRSEGGGLTSSGSPSGLMSARGAADFLTRATSILATLFIAMSILLAVLAASRHSTTVDASRQRSPEAPAVAPTPAGAVPLAPGNAAAPANTTPANGSGVPLQ